MITKEEYLTALETVDQYHKQLSLQIVSISCGRRTKTKDWLKKVVCTNRLRDTLEMLATSKEFEYIDDLEVMDLRRVRNVGKKSYDEFEKLKNTYLQSH
jgi:hypothetical protein